MLRPDALAWDNLIMTSLRRRLRRWSWHRRRARALRAEALAKLTPSRVTRCQRCGGVACTSLVCLSVLAVPQPAAAAPVHHLAIEHVRVGPAQPPALADKAELPHQPELEGTAWPGGLVREARPAAPPPLVQNQPQQSTRLLHRPGSRVFPSVVVQAPPLVLQQVVREPQPLPGPQNRRMHGPVPVS